LTSLLTLFSNNILPVFLAAGTGFLLGRYLNVNPKTLSQAVFYVFSPCLVFNLLTRSNLDIGDLLSSFSFCVLNVLIMGFIAWCIGRLLKLPRRMLVAVMLTSMFVNAGNFGMAVVDFALGEIALTYASVYFASNLILNYTIGVMLASMGAAGLKQTMIGVLKLPAIYAVGLAIIFISTDWVLPQPVARSIDILGDAAVPCMLVLLGLQFQASRWTGQFKPVLVANTLRLLAAPVLALTLSSFFGLMGVTRQAVVLEASMPPAVMNTVLATEFDLEPSFIAFVVFLGTILSPFVLTPMLVYLGA
jgi:predicted permease